MAILVRFKKIHLAILTYEIEADAKIINICQKIKADLHLEEELFKDCIETI